MLEGFVGLSTEEEIETNNLHLYQVAIYEIMAVAFPKAGVQFDVEFEIMRPRRSSK
jgi:hypothetical protein